MVLILNFDQLIRNLHGLGHTGMGAHHRVSVHWVEVSLMPVSLSHLLPFLFQLGNEQEQLEWAKRESKREEEEHNRRLRLQEQEDLELALALSRADMSRT